MITSVLLLALPLVRGGTPYQKGGANGDHATRGMNNGGAVHDSELQILEMNTPGNAFETGGRIGLVREKNGAWNLIYGTLQPGQTTFEEPETHDAKFAWTNGGKIKVVAVDVNGDLIDSWSPHRMCLTTRGIDGRLRVLRDPRHELGVERCSARTSETSFGCIDTSGGCQKCADEFGNPDIAPDARTNNCAVCDPNAAVIIPPNWHLASEAKVKEVLRNQMVMSAAKYTQWSNGATGVTTPLFGADMLDAQGGQWDCSGNTSGLKAGLTHVGKPAGGNTGFTGTPGDCNSYYDTNAGTWRKSKCELDNLCKWFSYTRPINGETTVTVDGVARPWAFGDATTGKCVDINYSPPAHQSSWRFTPPNIDADTATHGFTLVSQDGRFVTFRRTSKDNNERVVSFTHNINKAKVFRYAKAAPIYEVKNGVTGDVQKATIGNLNVVNNELVLGNANDQYSCLYYDGQVYFGKSTYIAGLSDGDKLKNDDGSWKNSGIVEGVGGGPSNALCAQAKRTKLGDFPRDTCRAGSTDLKLLAKCQSCGQCEINNYWWRDGQCKLAQGGSTTPTDADGNSLGGSCPILGTPGDKCRRSSECSGSDNFCFFGKCTQRFATGKECTKNEQCLTYFCDPGLQTCQAIPTFD